MWGGGEVCVCVGGGGVVSLRLSVDVHVTHTRYGRTIPDVRGLSVSQFRDNQSDQTVH